MSRRILLGLTVALAGCGGDASKTALGGDSSDDRFGCGTDELGIRQRLAIAGEQPWCDRASTPREGYRFIWGLAHAPVVVSVIYDGDSAIVHGYRAEHERNKYFYSRKDTTYTMHPDAFRVYIRGDDWRPGEPSTTGFNDGLWADESIEPVPTARKSCTGTDIVSTRWCQFTENRSSSCANRTSLRSAS